MMCVINLKIRQYILVGDQNSWDVALENKVWGFKEKNFGLWNKTKEGEFVLFYVTGPISKIFGMGQIEKKVVEQTLLWDEEKLANKPLMKYRFKLKILEKIPFDNGIPRPNNIMLNTGRKVIEQNQFLILLKTADKKWGTDLTAIFNKSKSKI